MLRLAMNGGQVQDPKFTTKGRPALAKERRVRDCVGGQVYQGWVWSSRPNLSFFEDITDFTVGCKLKYIIEFRHKIHIC